MSALYSATKSVFTLFVILALFSCMGKTEAEATIVTNTAKTTKTIKPGAAIKLVSNSLLSITANELAHIDILLKVMEPSGELTIDFSPSQGLTLKNTNTLQTIKFDSSTAIKIPVSLLATANGRHYLNMHISLSNTDSITVRNLAVIVQVGPMEEKTVKLQKVSGENIIALPARETISSQ